MKDLFTIMDGAIGQVSQSQKNINGVPGITFYFTRKTTVENLPIEVSFVLYQGEIQAVCRQDKNIILEPIMIKEEKYSYGNDIIFDKGRIGELLSSIPIEANEVKTVAVMKTMFGIDLSEIENIDGFEFDKLIYIDRMDMDFNLSDYFEGYMLVLHDISTKSLKLGMFMGTLSSYTYSEYLDELNEIGRNAILDNVTVVNYKNRMTITNSNKYRIEVNIGKYKYDVHRSIYADKHYKKREVSIIPCTLDAGESISFEHEVNQRERTYTLLSNQITPPLEDIFTSDSEKYLSGLEYIREEPFTVELEKVVSPMGVNSPGEFNIISSLFNILKDKNSFAHAIVDYDYDNMGLSIDGRFGTVKISDDDKIKQLIRVGGVGLFLKQAKIIFKTKLRKIYSALGEDILDSQFDYMLADGKVRILSISSVIAYNDIISTPSPALNVNFGFFADYDDVMIKNRHMEYKNTVYKSDMPCKEDKDTAISKILSTSVFQNDCVDFSINDVLKFPSKKIFSGSMYKTFNPEIDDAYAFYQKAAINEISGFSMATVPLSLTSVEIASVEPIVNIRSEDTECFDDFTYDQKEDIGALGMEVSMEDVLSKIKKSVHVFSPKRELVASFNLGLTYDKEWYYCGEDFFPAESIDNDIFTTYLDNEIVSMSRDTETSHRHIYDKKIFFDSMDYTDQYKEQLHDAFRALVVGDINLSTIHDNPGLAYIASHLIDRNSKSFCSFPEMIANAASVIFRNDKSSLNNMMMMPNLFQQMVTDKKSGYSSYVGEQDIHSFGKMREEYKSNYADLKLEDAYDSAYEIGHSVNLVFDKDMLHLAQELVSPHRKNLFGIEFHDFTTTDNIGIEKTTNYDIGGVIYSFAVLFTVKKEIALAIAYDYRTKELKIDNIKNLKIIDFPLLISSFDIFLHDFYKRIEGKKRISLGVYDFDSTSVEMEDELSKTYLLINSSAKTRKPSTRVFAVSVGSLEASIYVEYEKGIQESAMMNSQFENSIELSATLDNSGLQITKGVQLIHIPLEKLELSPSQRLIESGVSIQIYRAQLFLPGRFFGEQLTEVRIEIVGVLSSSRSALNMIGDLLYIPYGQTKKMSSDLGVDYNFALDGRGLQFWKSYPDYTTKIETAEDIDYIMASRETEKLYNINNLVCKIIFR